MPFRTILVAFDASDHSRRALETACGLARALGAELHVVSTPQPDMPPVVLEPFGGYVSVPPTDEQVAEAGAEVERQARALAAERGVDRIEFHARRGDPVDAVLSIAEASRADLIVLGRRGLGVFKAFALGSVSTAVTRGAKCPCLTVN